MDDMTKAFIAWDELNEEYNQRQKEFIKPSTSGSGGVLFTIVVSKGALDNLRNLDDLRTRRDQAWQDYRSKRQAFWELRESIGPLSF